MQPRVAILSSLGTLGPALASTVAWGLSRTCPRISSMPTFTAELDDENSIVQVVVHEDDGSEHDYQFDFDPKTGRWEFSERDLLERDFGDEWVEEMEEGVQRLIDGAVAGD